MIRHYKFIVFVNDVFSEDGSFMHLHDFNLIHGFNVNFLEYSGLIVTIREWLKNKKYPNGSSVKSLHAVYHSKKHDYF